MDRDYFVHESSYVDEGCHIGYNTKIWHFSHVMQGAHIGMHCNIGQNVYIDRNVSIGNGVKIQNNVSIYSNVTIHDSVFLGPSCVFTNVINPRAFIERKHEYKNTVVNEGASIGANATIVCGHNIGKYSFIGAGAVVTKDVPDYALMIGTPAKIYGYVCKCGNKLNFQDSRSECESCHSVYLFKNGNVKMEHNFER